MGEGKGRVDRERRHGERGEGRVHPRKRENKHSEKFDLTSTA